jgi:hypothetical protein
LRDRSSAHELAQVEGDDASVAWSRNDPQPWVPGADRCDAAEDPSPKFTEALSAWPTEVRVGLAQVALPQPGKAALHLGESEAFEVPA